MFPVMSNHSIYIFSVFFFLPIPILQKGLQEMNMWFTQLGFDGKTNIFFEKKKPLKVGKMFISLLQTPLKK